MAIPCHLDYATSRGKAAPRKVQMESSRLKAGAVMFADSDEVYTARK
jgi:hypothetical protein